MKWVSAVSENRLLQLAVAECAGEIENALDGETPDLTVASYPCTTRSTTLSCRG